MSSALPRKTKLARIMEIVIKKCLRKRPDFLFLKSANRTHSESVFGFELITYAPDGLELPFFGNALKLFAKTLYVNVNGS